MSLDDNKQQVHIKSSSAARCLCPTLTETLEFIMKGTTLPFGMVCDVISCFQHKAHELRHIKGVVGKLGMVPEGGMVTLRSVVIEESVYIKRMYTSTGKHNVKAWECACCQGVLAIR